MRWLLLRLLFIAVVVSAGQGRGAEPADEKSKWIWYDEGNALRGAPKETVWFRYAVKAAQPCTGVIRVACDNHFVLWVNGKRLGEGDFSRLYKFNLAGEVDAGTNVIGIEARNDGGPAGLYIDGEILYQGNRKNPAAGLSLDSASHWLATRDEPEGNEWLERDYDTAGWKPAKELATAEGSPWARIGTSDAPDDRFTLAEGFQIERIVEPELAGTLVNMTWGNRGRLIVSQEKGPLHSLVDNDGDGSYDRSIEFSPAVTNCQGICMVFDTLYAVGDGPQGTGMYRMPDRNGDDKADSVDLVILHEGVFPGTKGHVGDHGPHNVVLGPDGWLYHNMGNHARITHEREPTSGVADYYEGNLLEPRFEDARGHDGKGNPVPAGSVWRFTPGGQHWWLESVGYRNEFDIAFNADGELFTFDADMEWDVGTPWYRPCRVNHCVPGAEFGWRSGSAKWPAYYFDSLPETVDIGRGSPTGVVFYEHEQFPEKYRGAFIICDWSRGRILSVKLSPKGATFGGEAEVLVAGNPLNVSDIEVDRDGTLIFCTGGRNSEGGVYRVRFGDKDKVAKPRLDDALKIPQIHAAWAREAIGQLKTKAGNQWEPSMVAAARTGTPAEQVRALTLLSQFGPKPRPKLLHELARDDDAQVRAFAVWLLGEHPSGDTATVLADALGDKDHRVQRRACEAFVRSGLEAPVAELLPVLSSDDRWLRYAAREALKRVPADKWRDKLPRTTDWRAQLELLLALYQIDDKAFPADPSSIGSKRGFDLDTARLLQLGVIAKGKEAFPSAVALALLTTFPTSESALNMEIARLLAVLNPPGAIDKLLAMLGKGSQEEQIHYALCLRFVASGWTHPQRVALLDWYQQTRTWEGGASFVPFLENICGATFANLNAAERTKLVEDWQARPHATRMLVMKTNAQELAGSVGAIERLIGELYKLPTDPERSALLDAAIGALGNTNSPEVLALLRRLYDENPDRRNELARILAQHPTAENWPYLVRTLDFGDLTTLQLCIGGLAKIDRKPEKPADYRAVILVGLQIGDRGGLAAVNLLKRWTGLDNDGGKNARKALATYQRWFHDKYPQEPPAELPKNDPSKSRYSVVELTKFLDTDAGRAGDVSRGKQMFAKANCIKCHQFLREGQGVGPDLTSVRRRFQRKEIVESIVHPSKVISDQYRSVTVQTSEGLIYTGLPIKEPGNDKLVLMLPDATKLELAKSDVEETVPATISVMPENLLGQLSLSDVADLFAFLETSKNNDPAQNTKPPVATGAGR